MLKYILRDPFSGRTTPFAIIVLVDRRIYKDLKGITQLLLYDCVIQNYDFTFILFKPTHALFLKHIHIHI
jgi:hypothetical protein